MNNLINSTELSLQNKNWHAALSLALLIPDICGKIEDYNALSSKRYAQWFDKHLACQYNGFLSGDDCYAFRCALLHEWSSDIEKQKSKDIIDRFWLISNGPHCNKFSQCYFGNTEHDGKEILQLSVQNFCHDIIIATKAWINDSSIAKNHYKMIQIHENGFLIGGNLRIQ